MARIWSRLARPTVSASAEGALGLVDVAATEHVAGAGDVQQHGRQRVPGEVVQLAGDAPPLLGDGLVGERLAGALELVDQVTLADLRPAEGEDEEVGHRPGLPGDARVGREHLGRRPMPPMPRPTRDDRRSGQRLQVRRRRERHHHDEEERPLQGTVAADGDGDGHDHQQSEDLRRQSRHESAHERTRARRERRRSRSTASPGSTIWDDDDDHQRGADEEPELVAAGRVPPVGRGRRATVAAAPRVECTTGLSRRRRPQDGLGDSALRSTRRRSRGRGRRRSGPGRT